MFNFFEESTLITSADALKGRQEPISLNQKHYINGRSLNGPWEDYDLCILGMGCFWGAEFDRGMIGLGDDLAVQNPKYRSRYTIASICLCTYLLTHFFL